MGDNSWKVEGTKKGGIPLSVEKRPCGKTVTVVNNVTNPEKLLSDLQSMLGAGGSVKGNAIEVQGEHMARINKYLLAHKSQLTKVAGCKEPKVGDRPGDNSAQSAPPGPCKDEDRRESGKPRWSAAKVAAAQAARDRKAKDAVGAPPGWDEDPRRCPFNWIYCSGICTTQTMEEFARRKQQVSMYLTRIAPERIYAPSFVNAYHLRLTKVHSAPIFCLILLRIPPSLKLFPYHRRLR